MKKRVLVMASLFALSIMAVAQVALAQESMVANIPFEFSVGKTTLPAGEYSVRKSITNSDVLLIQRTDQSASLYVPSNSAVASETPSDSKLVFHRYGDRYFLSQVWTAGNPRGRQLMKSSREKEVALSARSQKPNQATIVARLTLLKP